MKSIFTLLFGIILGIVISYLTVMRGQSQIIHGFYSAGLADTVLLAARLRAGQQDKILANIDTSIPNGVLGARELGGSSKLSLNSLRLAKSYYNFTGLPIPTNVQTILQEVEPYSKNEYDRVRDLLISSPK